VEQTLLSEAAKSGLWALLFVALLWYVLKKNEEREKRLMQENADREKRYQDREDRYLEVIKTLGEEVPERLTKIENRLEDLSRGEGSR
jgi:hydrogenase maturation factor HypE